MLTLQDLIESADPQQYLGCFGDREFYAIRVVVASDNDGMTLYCTTDEWETMPEAVAIRLRKDVPFYEADIARLQHQVETLTTERDKARRALEVATQVQNTSYYAGEQWADKPRIYQPEELENMRRIDQADPPRCSVTGVRMDGPCPCSTCADLRRAYQSVDRLNAPAEPYPQVCPSTGQPVFYGLVLCPCASCQAARNQVKPIAFANGATLTPEQEQGLRRAVADLKQTNSHAVPLAPLLTRICRCEDCEAHRRVLAEGGSITTAFSAKPPYKYVYSVNRDVHPDKRCQCFECEELRAFLADANFVDHFYAELDGH